MIKFYAAAVTLLNASSAYAYIDPVTFNSIYELLVVLILTPILFLKTFIHWIGLTFRKIRRRLGKKPPPVLPK